ncbi:MAG: tetratricopeptide repeat protein, partial [Phycisphaeraceae bacterium]
MNDWSIAEQHAERAWRHYEAGRWDHALRLLRRALNINPDQGDWLFGLGLTLDALNRHEEAVHAYRKLIDLEPDDHEARLHLGMDLIRLGQPAEALDHIHHAHEIEPKQHACNCHKIAAHAQLGQHDQAELVFYLAQQEEPDCPVCFDHIAHSLAIRGELDRAIWCWIKTRELDPIHPQALANAARAHWYLGQLVEAKQRFEQHLDDQPEDAVGQLEFASLLLEIDDLDQAQTQLTNILKREPDHATAHHLLGDLHIKQNQPESAVAAYLAARQHQPERVGIDLGLAIAAQLAGDHNARQRHLFAELERSGQDARQVLELARQLLDAQLAEQTITLLTPIIDGLDDLFVNDDASLAEAHRLRALALLQANDHEQAIADCREAVRLCPTLTEAWLQLVDSYSKTGQLHRAIVCLNHAIELSPDDADLRKLAGKLRRQAMTRGALKSIR